MTIINPPTRAEEEEEKIDRGRGETFSVWLRLQNISLIGAYILSDQRMMDGEKNFGG